MTTSAITVDERLVKAMGHPLRFRLLTELTDRVASPRELSDALGEPLGNVSYHVRYLLDLDMLELVDTQPRRGAVEHYYRAVGRPFFDEAHWAELPARARRTLFDAGLKRIIDDVGAAASSGGFDRIDAVVSRTTLELDEEGWRELALLLAEMGDRVMDIQADSAGRGAGDISAEVGLLLFERAKRAAEPAKKPRRAKSRG
jgi:DNA-binding transcriptional ArsR family regulator